MSCEHHTCEREVEVGAADGELRLWLAKEGCRQGEIRLAAQAVSIQAMETRASSIMTWSVTMGIALVAATLDERYRAPAFVALIFVVCAAAAAAWSIWPRRWMIVGHRFSEMQKRPFSTELEHLEAMAQGAEEASKANDVRVAGFARSLRVAWVCLVSAPTAAGLVAAGADRL